MWQHSVLVNKHSGGPYVISRTVSGGAAGHAALSQVATVQPKRGAPTLTPTVKGHGAPRYGVNTFLVWKLTRENFCDVLN